MWLIEDMGVDVIQVEKQIIDDILFCKPLEFRYRGVDMFHIIDKFFLEIGLQWQNVIRICIDGARSSAITMVFNV